LHWWKRRTCENLAQKAKGLIIYGHCHLIPTTTIQYKKWTPHRPYFMAVPYFFSLLQARYNGTTSVPRVS